MSGGVQFNDRFSLWASSSAVVLETDYVDVTTAVHRRPGAYAVSDAPTPPPATSPEGDAEWADGRDARVSVSTDGNGYVLGAGMRALVLPSWSCQVGVSLVSYEDESDTVGGGLQYSLTDKVALGAVVSVADDGG